MTDISAILDDWSDAMDKWKRKLMHAMLYISEFYPGQSLEEVQSEYRDRMFETMQDYLNSDKPITAFKNEFNRTINDGFTFAFIAGWADAGAVAQVVQQADAGNRRAVAVAEVLRLR